MPASRGTWPGIKRPLAGPSWTRKRPGMHTVESACSSNAEARRLQARAGLAREVGETGWHGGHEGQQLLVEVRVPWPLIAAFLFSQSSRS